MKFKAKINGIRCEIEIDKEDLAALIPRSEMTQTELAKLWGVSRQTIRNRGVPKNKNGNYSLETIQEWAR